MKRFEPAAARGYPRRVRASAIAFAFLAALGVAHAQQRQGTYRYGDGKSAAWSIDDHHSLVWQGARYTPVGQRVDGSIESIDAASAAGIKDLLLDLPVGGGDWSGPISAAEKNGQRYMIRISSLSPGADAVGVDPAAYRISGVTGPQHLDLELPGCKEALVVVALKRDASIMTHVKVPVKDGRLVYDTKIHPDLENVVLVYPRTDRAGIPDLWEQLDAHRDALLMRLKQTKFAAGLRGVIDPLGRMTMLPGRELHGVPTSPAFRAELATVMEGKYHTIENALAAWSMSGSALSTYTSDDKGNKISLATRFSDLARLVPLWSGARGVSAMWDPDQDRLYPCNRLKSVAWDDIQAVVATAAARRVSRLCTAVQQVVNVPIVQEWAGWAGVTEDRNSPFDGMAARVTGDAASEIMLSGARSVSTVTRWSGKGWLVATDVPATKEDFGRAVDDLASMGLRAIFASGDAPVIAPEAARWASNPPVDTGVSAVYFPENASNPAAIQRLPGGLWWLPTPESGNRLDFGDSFFGYRTESAEGPSIVLWTRTPGRYLLRMLKPDTVTVSTLDGHDPGPKIVKNGLNVELTEVPLVIRGTNEIPVPEPAIKETLDEFTRLQAFAEVGHRGGTDEIYGFGLAASSFERNPGGSFMEMREQLRRFAAGLSPVVWIEAESSKDTTFSEVAPRPGASDGQALILRAAFPSNDGFTASYNMSSTSKNDVDLWVAAKIDPDRRRDLEAVVGGQTLAITEPPVSPYGDGFAWYHLGVTHLTATSKVVFRLRTPVGAEVALDIVVAAPAGWRPNGVAYPYKAIQ